MMQLLHVGAECFPIAKVGGLADVVGALPKYQRSKKIKTIVAMPYYSNHYNKGHEFEQVFRGDIRLGEIHHEFQVLKLMDDLGFDLFAIKIQHLLDRENVYGYEDDIERFIAFQIALLTWISVKKDKPALIHCHDHHTGLIPFMMSHCNAFQNLKEIPTVFTIHNAQYQGQFNYDKFVYIPNFDFTHFGLLDWDGKINPMASAVKCAWKVTTVSPRYMEELKSNGNGLQHLFAMESNKCSGILNGIDTLVWNPETDPRIYQRYKVI